MKCLILAAGYATRLYPLTENFPKPLLEVRGKTILDWLLDDLERTDEIEEYIVISNHKYYPQFQSWAGTHRLPIRVLDDGTVSNETRLGAVRDIAFAVEKLSLSGDLLVVAGDNLLDFSLSLFLRYAREKGTSCVMRYWEGDLNKLRKVGVAEVDENGRILSMEEKPAVPKSNWCTPPFYFYKGDDVPLVKRGIEEGCGVDAPGSFLAWLSARTAVHAFEMPGKRYDIGDLESYRAICESYQGLE